MKSLKIMGIAAVFGAAATLSACGDSGCSVEEYTELNKKITAMITSNPEKANEMSEKLQAAAAKIKGDDYSAACDAMREIVASK